MVACRRVRAAPCVSFTADADAVADDGGPVFNIHSMESTGMIGAAVYILLLTFFAPLPYYSHFLPAVAPSAAASHDTGAGSGAGAGAAEAGVAFPHHSLTTYLASLLSLLIATFLGFLDDLFDIRWRYKLPIPSASHLCVRVCVHA